MTRDRRTRCSSPRRAALGLVLAALAGLPGCAYLRHVGKDAGETLHVSLGASVVPGLHARVQAPLFGTSLGWLRRAWYVGTDHGHAHVWQQAAAGVVLGGTLVRTDLDADIGLYWTGYLADAYLDTSHYFVVNVVATDKRTSLGRRTLALSKFEAGVHLLFLGAQVGVDVLEVLDLASGLVGWDLLDDDDFDPAAGPPPDEDDAPTDPRPRGRRDRERPRDPPPDPLDEDDLAGLGTR